jgi:hypothetical protein
MLEIAISNISTLLVDSQVEAAVVAIEKQIAVDFSPIWNTIATLRVFPPGKTPLREWSLYILDDINQSDALGYHEDASGQIEGKVFVRDSMTDNLSWTVDLSQELLNMLGDPTTRAMATMPDGRQCVREVCSPVADDAVAYVKDGIEVSNFCTPAYFYEASGTVYDFCNVLSAPAPALAPGGYLGIYNPSTRQWTRATARLSNGEEGYRARRKDRTLWRSLNRHVGIEPVDPWPQKRTW